MSIPSWPSRGLTLLTLALVVTSCAAPGQQRPGDAAEANTTPISNLSPALDPLANPDPYPSTYQPAAAPVLAITNASVYTGTGQELHGATLVMRDGKIESLGTGIMPPADALVVDASGQWLTPGIIDSHSHLGVYPAPGVDSNQDGNELSSPNTSDVWAEHSVWPQDPDFNRARAGGVTSLQILPGSANLFGGRSVTLKNVPSTTVQGMKFPQAPYGLKMACGENPKRVYGARGSAPSTRMGNMAGYRAAWIQAADYQRRWDEHREKATNGESATPPARDLKLDTLAGVLRGEILVHNHCYRADEMAYMVDLSHEFGYRIAGFHHASEAYKIADLLAHEDICVMTWAGAWGGKLEIYDGIEENIALNHRAGGCAIVHSDDVNLVQRLNQETASALMAALRGDIQISKAEAIAWITANPARALGIGEQTGTLEPGKMADVVLWSEDPFSVYSRAKKVWIDGVLMYDRDHPEYQAISDFELGQKAIEEQSP